MLIKPTSLGRWIKHGRLVIILTTVLSVGSTRSDAETPFPGSQEVRVWVDSLRTEGIVLSHGDFQRLHEDPFCVVDRVGSPSGRYGEILNILDRKQSELQARYRAVCGLEDRSEIIALTRRYLEAIIYEILFPLWVGVDWDFFGVPGKAPSSRKPVACGHLLEKLLADAGFVVQKRAGTRLAYLAPKDFIQSVQGSEPKDHRDWASAADYLREHGPGLYFFGLEAGWGHVLMGRYLEPGKLWLLHSGPHPRGTSVSIDNGEHYLTEFERWQHIWVTGLNAALTVKWLEGSAFVPCVVMD